MTRRELLQNSGTAAAALAFSGMPHPATAGESNKAAEAWSFVHITDTHIQPELGATEGVAKAFAAVRALKEKPAFALVGGDLVFDANKVDRSRADNVYDLWRAAAADLGLPLHYSIGNHDAFALDEAATDSAKAGKNPDYGKNLWKHRLGLERTYDTFDHRGWRFITLDSVAVSPDGKWEGALDDEQLQWLDGLLRKTPKTMPLVFLTHIPLFTIFGQYTKGTTEPLNSFNIVKNGKAFEEMIQPYHVPAVFQGHTHVVEECRYLNTRYITGGAVCGDWWKGKRLGVHPEGFTVVTVTGNALDWKYVPYGWDAAAHQPVKTG